MERWNTKESQGTPERHAGTPKTKRHVRTPEWNARTPNPNAWHSRVAFQNAKHSGRTWLIVAPEDDTGMAEIDNVLDDSLAH